METDNTGSDKYATIRYAPVCAVAPSVGVLIIRSPELPNETRGQTRRRQIRRISWDEALDTIASSLKKTVENMAMRLYIFSTLRGLLAAICPLFSISLGGQTPDELLRRFINQYGSYSTAQISCAMPYTYAVMMATAPRILKTASWS